MHYENRAELYKFLIDDGFKIIEEKYYPEAFGNFYVILTGRDVLLRYVNDRSIISVDISKDMAKPEWYYIFLVKALLYKEQKVDSVNVEKINNFIKNEIDKIVELFNDVNYPATKESLIKIRDRNFKLNFPGW